MKKNILNSSISLLFLFFMSISYAQEICADGIDNDGDGLIDLLDDDCPCSDADFMEPENLITNGSFEDYDNCPNTPALVEYCSFWDQPSEATSDFYHGCNFDLPYDFWGFADPGIPLPDGEAYMGFHDIDWPPAAVWGFYKEYISQCLSEPLDSGMSYTFGFWLARANGLDTVDVALYGNPNCADIEWEGMLSPMSDEGVGWVILGETTVAVVDSNWVFSQFTFTTPMDIDAITFGPAVDSNGVGFPESYYYLDEISIYDAFHPVITESGTYCDGLVELLATSDTPGGTWQWYLDGIALVGQTSPVVDAYTFGEGTYSAVYTVDGGCARTDYIFEPDTYMETTLPIISICYGTSIEIFGIEQDVEGTYSTLLESEFGCDSMVFQPLEIKPENVMVLPELIICEGDSALVFDDYYSTSGEYSEIYEGVDGCDSTIIQVLVVENIVASITVTDTGLVASPLGYNYQWVHCFADGTYEIIDGETDYIFLPTESGDYAVIISSEHCSDKSPCVDFEYKGYANNPSFNKGITVSVFPNPFSESTLIQLNGINASNKVVIEVWDILGQQVLAKQLESGTNEIRIDKSEISAGAFLMNVYIDGISNGTYKLVVLQ